MQGACLFNAIRPLCPTNLYLPISLKIAFTKMCKYILRLFLKSLKTPLRGLPPLARQWLSRPVVGGFSYISVRQGKSGRPARNELPPQSSLPARQGPGSCCASCSIWLIHLSSLMLLIARPLSHIRLWEIQFS